MDPAVISMVVIIVLVVLAFTLVVVRWGLQHEEKKLALQSSGGDVARLEQVVAVTQTEMAGLRARVQVLEKLATDEDRRLAGDIERLRGPHDRSSIRPDRE